MKLSDYFRKRIYFFVISLFFVVLSVTLATVTFSLSDVNRVNIADHVNSKLVIEYYNGSDVLNVSEYPILNEVGASYAPINLVKVINKTSEVQKYDLVISTTSMNEIDDLNKIYVSVNNESYNSLASLDGGIIMSSKIQPNSEEVADVRIWISKDNILESDYGKNLGLKLSVKEY